MSMAVTASAPTSPVHRDWRQSLADGAPGTTLPHIARARAGIASWQPVHDLTRAMTRDPIHAHPDRATLFRGAPAVAYTLHAAGHRAYSTALTTLDKSIATLIRQRLAAAHRRIQEGCLPQAREYDLMNGLTGLGVYVMHRHHDHTLLRDILTYLVRLTQPVRLGPETLPGWWATGSPDRRRSPRWDGGHAGFGMAHGISGPLALLSTAMRHGIIVTGHHEAIHAICAWLDDWRTGHDRQAWWPEVVDRDEQRSHTLAAAGPHRPSWCYGTPGIARAQQLAGIATGDPGRARVAEQALLGSLTDDRQLAHLTDSGLCHGWAGLVHTARRAAADSTRTELAAAAGTATTLLHRHVRDDSTPRDGFLDGGAGTELVIGPAATSTPSSWWDACLLG
jgi:hypothetical protein